MDSLICIVSGTGCNNGNGGKSCCTSSNQCKDGEGDCDDDMIVLVILSVERTIAIKNWDLAQIMIVAMIQRKVSDLVYYN